MKITVADRSTLIRWDVKYQFSVKWADGIGDTLRPLGECAQQRIEEAPAGFPLGSISFEGQIFRRESGRGGEGRLHLARPGDVVFSRIDIRNGAIGVLDEDGEPLAFSGEYPVYDLADAGLIRPAFMRLLCRTEVFRAEVNAQVVGHSGRKRLPASEFEKLLLPMFRLEEQDEILKELDHRLRVSACIRAQALPLVAEAAEEMLDDLGIVVPKSEPVAGPFLVRRSDIKRWSVRKAMAAYRGASQEIESDRPLHPLGDPKVSDIAYGITKSPKNRPRDKARPYLRVANVQDGFLDLRRIMSIEVSDEDLPKYLLQDEDLLVCEGNSIELVGRPAIWKNEISECVHQNHVLRVRVNRNRLLPEFLFAYMHGPAGRWYFEDCAKRTTNLATINSTDLRRMPVPLPSLTEQKILSDRVREAREKAHALVQQSAAQDANTEAWLAGRLGSTAVA